MTDSIRCKFRRAEPLLLTLIVSALTSCTKAPSPEENLKAAPKTLLVSAAISLKSVLMQISQQFEIKTSTKISANFGSSGELAAQLRNGAPVDIFISADPAIVAQLSSEGIVEAASAEQFAGNTLVAVSSDPQKFSNASDLLKAKYLAVGNPETVPEGKYAKKALETLDNIYGKLLRQKKLVFAENARQVLAFAESGECDAAVVYSTDAALSSKCKVCFEIPKPTYPHIIYQASLVKESKSQEQCKAFLNFLKTSKCKDILSKAGFSLP